MSYGLNQSSRICQQMENDSSFHIVLCVDDLEAEITFHVGNTLTNLNAKNAPVVALLAHFCIFVAIFW
jgi:hypothetical protein